MNGFNDGTTREANRARAYHPGPMRVIHRVGTGRASGALAAIGVVAALLLATPSDATAAPKSQSGAEPTIGPASPKSGRWFVVAFENKDRSDVLRVPNFAELAKRGEQFPRFVGGDARVSAELPRDGRRRHVRAR
jgi:hypothetical protein